MAIVIKKLEGSLPVSRQKYTEGTTYYKDNIVTHFGSAFQCVVESTTTPPATLDESGSVVLGEGWIFFADTSAISNAVAEHTEKITKIEQLLQEGYTFMGVATPETNPGTPDRKVFYIANGKGAYANFGGININEDEVILLTFDDVWNKMSSGIASNSKLTELSWENKEALLYATNRCSLNIPSSVAGSNDIPIFPLKKGYTCTIKVQPLQNFEGILYWGLYKASGGETIVEKSIKSGEIGEATFTTDAQYDNPILYFYSTNAKPSISCVFNIVNSTIVDIDTKVKGLRSEVDDAKKKINLTEQGIDKIFVGEANGELSMLPTHDGYIDNTGNHRDSSEFQYVNISLADVKSIRFIAPLLSDTVTVNAHDSKLNFIKNLIDWEKIDNKEYIISSLPKGTAFLVVSVKSVDLSVVSYYVQTTSITELADNVADLEKKQHFLSAKINGGDIEESIAKFPIVSEQYVTSLGVVIKNAEYSYSLIPRNNADKVILNAPNMIDTCIINLVDANGDIVANLGGDWIKLNNFIIPNDLHTNATSIGLSFKNVDIDKIIVTYRYVGVKSNDEASLSDIDEMSARYDAAYNKTLAVDKPLIKGLFIDCGRKYFSISNLKKFIDDAAAAGLNTFFYYFSDNQGFRFALNDMSVNVNDATYDLSVCLGDGEDGGDGTNKWITETEMDDLIPYANAKGIQFIPSFDMPGHMGAIRQHFNSSEFMETTELGRKWMVAVYKKYVSYFASRGCKYFNICGDEYSGNKDVFNKIITQLVRCVTSYGLIPMLYNDEICRNGYLNPFISNGAIILGWIRRGEQASYQVIRDSGYKMLNAKSYPYYWVLGVTKVSDALLAAIRTTNPFIMADNSEDKDVQGAVYHIWCDNPATDGTDEGNNVYEQTKPFIQAFGQNMRSHFPCKYMPKEHICLKDADGAVYKLTVSTSGEIVVSKLTNS